MCGSMRWAMNSIGTKMTASATTYSPKPRYCLVGRNGGSRPAVGDPADDHEQAQHHQPTVACPDHHADQVLDPRQVQQHRFQSR